MKACRGRMRRGLWRGWERDVVKVESPGGDLFLGVWGLSPTTVFRIAEKSALFLALNAGKRGVTLDLESDTWPRAVSGIGG